MTILRKALDESGMKLKDISVRLGISSVTMSRYVSMARIPNVETAIRIARTLGKSVEELWG